MVAVEKEVKGIWKLIGIPFIKIFGRKQKSLFKKEGLILVSMFSFYFFICNLLKVPFHVHSFLPR